MGNKDNIPIRTGMGTFFSGKAMHRQDGCVQYLRLFSEQINANELIIGRGENIGGAKKEAWRPNCGKVSTRRIRTSERSFLSPHEKYKLFSALYPINTSFF